MCVKDENYKCLLINSTEWMVACQFFQFVSRILCIHVCHLRLMTTEQLHKTTQIPMHNRY